MADASLWSSLPHLANSPQPEGNGGSVAPQRFGPEPGGFGDPCEPGAGSDTLRQRNCAEAPRGAPEVRALKRSGWAARKGEVASADRARGLGRKTRRPGQRRRPERPEPCSWLGAFRVSPRLLTTLEDQAAGRGSQEERDDLL
ncbi:hypothetical protein NDU88_008762 [Pleurodeles waltl]|uniref:Uncharacterized protein n=1 Tax=Pleurodeles waltl TaxID=8319 RepID=A0AAV7PRB7_PLEWA|nr:hypothetical protein NDU88_008762 [Pleurodeles waltl]